MMQVLQRSQIFQKPVFQKLGFQGLGFQKPVFRKLLGLCLLCTLPVLMQQSRADEANAASAAAAAEVEQGTEQTTNQTTAQATAEPVADSEQVAQGSETQGNESSSANNNESDAVVETSSATETQADAATADPMEQPIPALSAEEQSEADGLVNQVVDRVREAQAAEEAARPKPPEDAIRINYVPEFIKQEIRDQVRANLRSDVVDDVLTQAKNERWGIPDALPSWVNKVKIKGDVRVRMQNDDFADGNLATGYTNVNVVNASGGFDKAGPEKFYNITEDRLRMRARARVKVDAKVTEGVKAGLRLSTGNEKDPVSTNQTLGTYDNRYRTVWDQVYIQHDNYDADAYHWLTLMGGRMPNPWFSTDLVWDSDIAFEGLAATYRHNLSGSDSLYESDLNNRTLFFTAGIFPLQEVELSDRDKWLYGAQLGAEFISLDQSKFKIALAYYFYDNITGIRNKATESTDYDYTAPAFMQKGNVLFNIRNSDDDEAELWALAAEYHELNLTMMYDMAKYSPLHVIVTADVVKNIGYNQDDVEERAMGVVDRSQGWSDSVGPTKERSLGYQVGVLVGWPRVTLPGNWNVSLHYKYLQRDAVLDAFTDSDFLLGGTDAKGWILTGKYGLEENTWLSVRWITADAIDGTPMNLDGQTMGIDTLQVDVNAKF